MSSEIEQIEDKHRLLMNAIAEALNDLLTPNGFALLVFDFHKLDGTQLSWVSNARHDDMICLLRAFVASEDGRVHEAHTVRQ